MASKTEEEKAKKEAEVKAKAEAEAKAKTGAGEKLIAEACKAYGIDEKYVGGSHYDSNTKTAIIVTLGGAKVRYQKGDKAEKLDPIRVTGVNPNAAKKKPIFGKKR